MMVLGTSPKSAKSVLTIALCRALVKKGRKVCPFKAVSVVQADEGLNAGTLHGVLHQCQAARVSFEAAMNPIVVRAGEALTGEVFIAGIPAGSVRLLNEDTVLTNTLSPSLKYAASQRVRESYCLLRDRYDFVIIEGAGSPCDLPQEEDIPNLFVARFAAVPIVFSCKFSRGGAAAALIGSVNCLPAEVRNLVVGFTFSDVQEEDSIGHSVRLVEGHLGIPYLGSVPRVPLWTDGVDSYELLACTALANLDWKAMQLDDIFVGSAG